MNINHQKLLGFWTKRFFNKSLVISLCGLLTFFLASFFHVPASTQASTPTQLQDANSSLQVEDVSKQLCYIETENGRQINLDQLCKPNSVPEAERSLQTSFTPQDVVVSNPAISLQDPEFDQVGYRFAWQDSISGILWVAHVDPITGDFIPSNGQETAVDSNIYPQTGNGPEWGYSQNGAEIFYTKFEGDQPTLAKAHFSDDAGWIAAPLQQGLGRSTPTPSATVTDVNARIYYVLGVKGSPRTSFWREDNLPNTETEVIGSKGNGFWIPGQAALLTTTKDANRINQVALYDTTSNTLSMLTSDGGSKDKPHMWQAPEYNNEYLFFTLVDSNVIKVYRNINSSWTLITTLDPPGRPYLVSPEVFTYGGKSYISMAASDSPDNNANVPSDVWIARLGGQYRQVSNTNTALVRRDPEFLIAQNTVYIYYTEIASNKTRVIHRCTTGL